MEITGRRIRNLDRYLTAVHDGADAVIAFDEIATLGDLVEVEVEAATSQTLNGYKRLLSRAG